MLAVVDVDVASWLVEVVVLAVSAVTPSELGAARQGRDGEQQAPADWWTRPQSIP